MAAALAAAEPRATRQLLLLTSAATAPALPRFPQSDPNPHPRIRRPPPPSSRPHLNVPRGTSQNGESHPSVSSVLTPQAAFLELNRCTAVKKSRTVCSKVFHIAPSATPLKMALKLPSTSSPQPQPLLHKHSAVASILVARYPSPTSHDRHSPSSKLKDTPEPVCHQAPPRPLQSHRRRQPEGRRRQDHHRHQPRRRARARRPSDAAHRLRPPGQHHRGPRLCPPQGRRGGPPQHLRPAHGPRPGR